MILNIVQKAGKNHLTINQKLRRTLPITDIVMCVGQINYTVIHLLSGRQVICPRTIKLFEKRLQDLGFVRTHRAFLVNPQYCVRFDSSLNILKMTNGKEAKISRRKRENLGVQIPE